VRGLNLLLDFPIFNWLYLRRYTWNLAKKHLEVESSFLSHVPDICHSLIIQGELKMGKSTYDRILEILKNSSAQYEIVSHQPVYTSEEASRTIGHEEREGTKSLVLQDGEFIVVVTVSGDEKIDFKKVARLLSRKKLKMTQEETMKEMLGVNSGGVAPFGYDTNFPLVISKKLLEMSWVYINPGKNDVTIKIKGDHFAEIMKKEKAMILP